MAEDNEINAMITVEILSQKGMQIDVAENGQLAVERFASQPPGTYAMILMDVQMPVMDGRAATRAIRTLNRPDAVLSYAIRLCEAIRPHPLVELGISPRDVSALVRMARACAVLRERNYVVPEDVQNVYTGVCAHRLVLRPQARVDGVGARELLEGILMQMRPEAGAER